MGELVFIGLGLFDDFDISLRGFEEIRKSDFVFAEFYTSLMAGFSLERFMREVGKEVNVVTREMLEEGEGRMILEKAVNSKVALLVPGDPLIATTHIDLQIRAKKLGIRTKIVHGSSIISAVIGLSGLQNYKFGRSVTIPLPEANFVSKTPYNVIRENKIRNLHTLCFLDIRIEEKKFMTIDEALRALLILEKEEKKGVVTWQSLAIGIARAGADDVTVKADYVSNLIDYDFGGPPHALVLPADRLHFMEAEALINLANAPLEVREMIR